VHVNRAARRALWCTAPLILLLSMCLTTRLAAQAPASRIFASAGTGIGKSGPAQSLGQDQYKGQSFDAAAGVTMTSRGLIGVDASYWHKDTPIGSSHSIFVTLTLIGYPFGSALNDLFFQGGLGVGHGSLPTHVTSTTVQQLDVTHPALLVGLGYDIPISCPLWLTPFIQSYGTFGGHRITGASSGTNVHESANAVLYHAGVSLKYVHPGPAGQCRKRVPALTQQ
jgi:hypothetical protein